MATLPTRTLEIEFDTGVWTDISADVVALSTRRGRNKESGAFETGQLVFSVRNDSRKYDPDNTAGTYYGKLRPNRRVRLSATYSAVVYPVFVGYIDRIAQVYGGPNDATAEFQVSDLFKILNRIELPSSAYAAEIAGAAPAHWWRFGEPDTATVAADAMGAGYELEPVGNPTFGESSLPVREPDGAVAFATPSDGLFGVFTEGTWPVTTAGTLEYWYRQDDSGADPLVGLFVLAPTPFGVDALVNSDGNVEYILVNTAGTFFSVSSTGAPVNDGEKHHIALTWSAGSPIKIYIDGIDRTSAAVNFTGTMSNTTAKWGIWINGIDYPPYILTSSGSIGTYDEVAMYTTALSAATIAAHNEAGRTPWDGDLPRDRLERIFDLANIAAGDQAYTDDGTTYLQSTSLGGNALGYAQKVEETEAGWLFVRRDGKLQWIGREYGHTGAYLTSLATFVDDDSGAGIPYRSVSADVDEARIVTRATVSRDGSVAFTYEDAAAIAEFQIIDETHDGLLHDDDTYSLSYAQWIVNTHKTPSSRVGTVTFELTKDPATMYPAILALEIADRVTYKRKPQNSGSVITLTMRIEAISHSTGGHYWTTSLQLSPFNLGENGYAAGVWDVSLWDQAVWGL